jgi:hypothetical protein
MVSNAGSVYDEDHPTGRFNGAASTGGICMKDKDNMATKVLKDIVGKVGKSIITGNIVSMMSITTPAYVHSEISYLDTVVYEILSYEYYINKIV